MPVYIKMKGENEEMRDKQQLHCVRIKFDYCLVRTTCRTRISFITIQFDLHLLYYYEGIF